MREDLEDAEDDLNSKEVPEAVDAKVVSKAKECREDPREDHAQGEEVPEVDPLRHDAADEHGRSIAEEVGSVEEAEVGLGTGRETSPQADKTGFNTALVTNQNLFKRMGSYTKAGKKK